MLTIRVGGTEAFDDVEGRFTETGGTILELEHSLVSLSKWESIFEKPFLSKDEKTASEIVTYIKCMCLTADVPNEVFQQLTNENFEAVHKYIEAKNSATWFSEAPGAPKSREVVTSELIYYWLTVFQIPFTCETWNLNRLFTLIRICNMKAAKPKKMSKAEIGKRNRELNEQRKAQLGTTG